MALANGAVGLLVAHEGRDACMFATGLPELAHKSAAK